MLAWYQPSAPVVLAVPRPLRRFPAQSFGWLMAGSLLRFRVVALFQSPAGPVPYRTRLAGLSVSALALPATAFPAAENIPE
jgi:hypothetical protein